VIKISANLNRFGQNQISYTPKNIRFTTAMGTTLVSVEEQSFKFKFKNKYSQLINYKNN